ncbi:MAG: transketolase family protein, partial [Blastocatellia bacterium]
ALAGRIPVAHALAAFLTMRAFEFIRTDIALPNLPVKLIGGVPGFLSEANGPTHQAIEDVALMRTIPNMRIFCPADADEMVLGLPHILKDPNPWYVRYNASKRMVSHSEEFIQGKSELLADGGDVAIISYGLLVAEALWARDILESQGIFTRVINLRTIRPLDEDAILRAARETRLIVTLEDHFLTGGLYSITAELFLRARVLCDVMPVAFEDRWFKPALLHDAIRYEGFAGDQLAERISHRLRQSTAGPKLKRLVEVSRDAKLSEAQ